MKTPDLLLEVQTSDIIEILIQLYNTTHELQDSAYPLF